MREYQHVTWHTSDGVIQSVAIKYEQTLLQWILRRPADEKKWVLRNGDWYIDYGNGSYTQVDHNRKNLKEFYLAMDQVNAGEASLDRLK